MNAIELLRKRVVEDVHKLGSINDVWEDWSRDIINITDGNIPSNAQLRELGNSLYDIFRGTSKGDRSQGSVSGGGAAWEGLVCWYLNLCLTGSRTVVIKSKKANIPECILHSISVNYGNFKSNTESDLLAVTFPNDDRLIRDYEGDIKVVSNLISAVTDEKFHETELTVIQCKTNWNDNAQIPMLWDLIYASEGFSRGATVGSNGYSHNKLKSFNYAFATVPTVNPSHFKPTSTAVKRVQKLSGGNFWALPSKSGIAMNIADMLDRNFQSALNDYAKGWNQEISKKIEECNQNNYFKL